MGDESKFKTAEQMGKEQRAISVSEFFEKNRHLLGFDNAAKALLTVVKEAVDNSLDACEEAGILPDLTIKIKQLAEEDRIKVTIQDNGPGIVKKQIPNIFAKLLYGSKFGRNSQSLTADEPILVKENNKVKIIPIGEFIDKHLNEKQEIKDVLNENLFVPSFSFEDGKYSMKKVSKLIRHKRQNEILKINTHLGKSVKVTGCHSLFTFDSGKIKEVEARNLKAGNYIVVPKKLPEIDDVREINILDYITINDVKNNWFYVYNIDKKLIRKIFKRAEIIHKKTSKSRRFYRFKTKKENIDILDDSVKQYLKKGFLPLNLVTKLGLKELVKDCFIVSYYHGKKTKFPVTMEITENFVRFLGLFVAEGHTDVRQIGFTFGKHENHLIDEIIEFSKIIGLNTTIENRESTIRIKVFNGILSLLMRKWCGRGAKNKQVPEFIFKINKNLRQHFLDALYQGDGHKVKNRNCIALYTVSQNLANQIIYLWSMQGIFSSLIKKTSKGLGKYPSQCFVISVYGRDINNSFIFNCTNPFKISSAGKRFILNDNGLFSAVHLKDVNEFTSDLCLLKIKNIEKINKGYEYVYDISVPKCENFVGGIGGISCHNSRGQQGIGISSALLYSQLTTGKATIIRSRVKGGKVHEFHLRIDTIKNEPQIIKEEVSDNSFAEHGTYVEMEIEAKYRRGSQSVDEYLKETALANPHSKLSYYGPDGKITYNRIVSKLPKLPKSIKSHPYGVELGVFERMSKGTRARSCAAFISNDFCRVGMGTAEKVCKASGIKPSTPTHKLNHKDIEKIWRNLQKAKLMNPPLNCLSPIGEKVLEEALKKDLKVEFSAAITRPPSVYRGNPFAIEVAIGYGGELKSNESAQIFRLANKVPLLYEQSSCAITKALRKIDWRHYRVEHQNRIPTGPIAILIHFYSTWIPYTSESKEAIDAYPEVLKEIRLALQDCLRKLKSFLAGKRRRFLDKQRQSLFEKYIPELSDALAKVSEDKKEKIQRGLDKILHKEKKNNGDETAEEEKSERGKPQKGLEKFTKK